MASNVKAGGAFIEIFAKDAKLRRSLARVQKKMRMVGKTIRNVGASLLAAGAISATAIAPALVVYTSFSDQMLKVKGIIVATGKQFELLNEKAKLLGRTTSFTASQVAAGMVKLGRAGFKTNEIDKSIASILDLSKATDTDLALAAEIAGNAMSGFNIKASDSARVIDVLTATANNSSQSLTDLGESLKFVAPTAVEAGASIEDVSANLAILANNGIRGSMAGTALDRAYKNLSSSKVSKTLKSIGVAALDSSGNIRPLSTIINEIGDATKDFGSGVRLDIFQKLFGRGQGAALKLAAAGSKLTDVFAKIKISSGVAKETAAVMDSGIGGVFRRLMSAVEGVAISIGESLAGELSEIGEQITEVAGIVSTFISKNSSLVLAIGKVIIGVTAAGAALVVIGSVISLASFAIGGIVSLISGLISVVSAVAGVFAFLISPIGLAIAAVVAAGVVIGKQLGLWGGLVDFLKEKFSFLSSVVSESMGAIQNALKSGNTEAAARVLWAGLNKVWREGTARIDEIWINMTSSLMSGIASAMKFIMDVFGTSTSSIIESLRTLQNKMTSFGEETSAFFVRVFAKIEGVDEDELNQRLESLREEQKFIRESKDTSKEDAERKKALDEFLDPAKIEEKRVAAIDASRAEVQKAKEEFDDAVKAANELKKKERAEGAEETAADKAKKAVVSNGATIKSKTNLSSVGTFSAAAVRGFSQNKSVDETAKSTKQTALNTSKMLRKMGNPGITFS